MSRFFSDKLKTLVPYVPGEQPQDRRYIKLNTNESPFPPSEKARKAAAEAAESLNLYSDPDCRLLCRALAAGLGVRPENVVATNGSDEALNFAMMAFCSDARPAVFPDVTYGFYRVFAELNGVPYEEIPLRDDFSLALEDYVPLRGRTLFLANPNAPTGLTLGRDAVENLARSNPDSLIIVDEAYVDFGGETCVPLTERCDNVLVIRTFSKSRSMAGARLGFAVGCEPLIRDLNTVRFSTNPYNVNSMTMAAGIGALADEAYTQACLQAIIAERERTAAGLRERGFEVLPSTTNFVFARHPAIGGRDLYLALKDRGVLIRHFETPRLKDWNRITIGSAAQRDTLLEAIDRITEAKP